MYTVPIRHQSQEDAMGYNFLPCDRDQLYLLPAGDLAWFILDAVAQIDRAKIGRTDGDRPPIRRR